ncbi:ubiquitin-like protein Pup [Catenulispora sp. EB89]|uniref:ubiquitin-like protein Pup n=1 Tax=unclassified Catenulispora TaxID=414885 RepID=UPI003518F4B4
MAADERGGQQHASRDKQEVEETATEASSDLQERQEKLSEDVDSMLDEIDEVLEANSEDFVRGFVQKGGQ